MAAFDRRHILKTVLGGTSLMAAPARVRGQDRYPSWSEA